MRKRILGVSIMTVALVAGLLAVPALAATGVKAPAPPRADAAAEQPEPPPPGGFCIDVDRDRKYVCVGRLKPASEPDCRTLVRLGTLIAYTSCTPRRGNHLFVGGAAPVAVPVSAGGASAQKATTPEGPLGNGFCVNINRDDTWTCALRNKPRSEPNCTTIIGINGVLVHTECEPFPKKR